MSRKNSSNAVGVCDMKYREYVRSLALLTYHAKNKNAESKLP